MMSNAQNRKLSSLLDRLRQPPPGFGEVGFHWWLGDPLTKERLRYQLDQLRDMHVSGVQVNYAHSDSGGASYGLTYPSDPPLFSEAWWELFGWFMNEAKRQGISVSLSDYTIGPPGQGWYTDQILRQHPEMSGQVLRHTVHRTPPGICKIPMPPGTLSALAIQYVDDQPQPETAVHLHPTPGGEHLDWQALEGDWRVVVVSISSVPISINPMHRGLGAEVCRHLFQQFEDRLPGEAGRGLNFFFSDELAFNVTGELWVDDFAAEFERRKGYDLVPELASLFIDTGPRTPKVRLDYWDVLVALEEERYFKPIFDWHESRGMIYGCDHGGRGRDVAEFGDYFRTQRWNQGPGADQPKLGKDIIKAKVAASIAHLYRRPRVWLEGFYSSGWGTTLAQVADATFANFAMGFNLLTLHGMYYSTHGGYWEWAPPCNHHHMPYWRHTQPFMQCVERLSYLMSLGTHRCDVAILYPVESAHAGVPGRRGSASVAFAASEALYASGIDFDFIDAQSIEAASVAENRLCAADEQYRVVVIPDMPAMRWRTLGKLHAFRKAGGIVVAIGDLPAASDRAGRDDAELGRLVGETAPPDSRLADASQLSSYIASRIGRDFACAVPDAQAVSPYFQHRVIDGLDLYYVYNLPRRTACTFRAVGSPVLWNPWTAVATAIPVIEQTATHTTLQLPLEQTEPHLIFFAPGDAVQSPSRAEALTETIALDGDWQFELQPSLDNRFGDFEWPPSDEMIGAQVRQIRYRPESSPDDDFSDPAVDDAAWPTVTCSFGVRFWQLGPLPDNADTAALERVFASTQVLDPSKPVTIGDASYYWQPYAFSWRWGLEGDPGPQGYHGLKGRITDDFIALGRRAEHKHSSVYLPEDTGRRYFLWTSVHAPERMSASIVTGGVRPAAIFVNGERVSDERTSLKSGANPVLLRYDDAGRSHVVFGEDSIRDLTELPVGSLRMRWHGQPSVLQYDAQPQLTSRAGWYRFEAPPGLTELTLTVLGESEVWIDGEPVELRDPRKTTEGACRYSIRLPNVAERPGKVAIRVVPQPGCHGGAALPEPIRLTCARGTWTTGDWSRNDGLHCYSGTAEYRRSFVIPTARSGSKFELDLGHVVSTAEIWLNDRLAATCVTPPWRVDITPLVRPGENELRIRVCSTLANHYTTIPSRYRGSSTAAGLIGPVMLRVKQ